MVIASITVIGTILTVLVEGYLDERQARSRSMQDTSPIFERVEQERRNALSILAPLLEEDTEVSSCGRSHVVRQAQVHWLIAEALLSDMEHFYARSERTRRRYGRIIAFWYLVLSTSFLVRANGGFFPLRDSDWGPLIALFSLLGICATVLYFTPRMIAAKSKYQARREMLKELGIDNVAHRLTENGTLRRRRWYDNALW